MRLRPPHPPRRARGDRGADANHGGRMAFLCDCGARRRGGTQAQRPGWTGRLLGQQRCRPAGHRVHVPGDSRADSGCGRTPIQPTNRRTALYLRIDTGGSGILLGRWARSRRGRADVGIDRAHLRNAFCRRCACVRHDARPRAVLLGCERAWPARRWIDRRSDPTNPRSGPHLPERERRRQPLLCRHARPASVLLGRQRGRSAGPGILRRHGGHADGRAGTRLRNRRRRREPHLRTHSHHSDRRQAGILLG